MGVKGVGVASAFSNAFILLGINIYPLFVPKVKDAMRLPTRDAFREWKDYLKKGIPVSFMLCFEWWAFEFIVIMAGSLGVVELSVQTIFMNVIVVLFALALGSS